MVVKTNLSETKSSVINKLGLFLMFVALIIFGIQIILRNYKNIRLAKEQQIEKSDVVNQDSKQNKQVNYDISNRWRVYQDTIYGYEIAVPKLLIERKYKNNGRFVQFVLYEETQFSNEKGVALGISKLNIEKEIDELKKDMTNEKAVVASEENIKVDGFDGILINFEPEDEEILEKRSVFLVSKNNLTFSISSVPEQIPRLIDNFKFLN